MTSPGTAAFAWRSGADRVLELADEVTGGASTVAEVLRYADVGEWLERISEYCYEGSAEPLEDEAWCLAVLTDVAAGRIDPRDSDGPYAFYRREDDRHFEDAARALPLPPWAEIEVGFGGGVGSGYDAQYLVLAKGKRLEDLAGWLAASLRTAP